jgi:hypothetical protein
MTRRSPAILAVLSAVFIQLRWAAAALVPPASKGNTDLTPRGGWTDSIFK